MEALKTFQNLPETEKIRFFQALAQPVRELAIDPEASASACSSVPNFATIFEQLSKNALNDSRNPDKLTSPESKAKQKTLDSWLVKKSSPKIDPRVKVKEKSFVEAEQSASSIKANNADKIASDNVPEVNTNMKASRRKDSLVVHPEESSPGPSALDSKEALSKNELVCNIPDEPSSNPKRSKQKGVTWSCQLFTDHPNTCTITKHSGKKKQGVVSSHSDLSVSKPVPDVDNSSCSSQSEDPALDQNSSCISVHIPRKKDATPEKTKPYDKFRKSQAYFCPSQDLLMKSEVEVAGSCNLGENTNNNQSEQKCSALAIETNNKNTKHTKKAKIDEKPKNDRNISESLLNVKTSSIVSLNFNHSVVSIQNCKNVSNSSQSRKCQAVRKGKLINTLKPVNDIDDIVPDSSKSNPCKKISQVIDSNKIPPSSSDNISKGQNIPVSQKITSTISNKGKLCDKSKKLSNDYSHSSVSVSNLKNSHQHSNDDVTSKKHCSDKTASKQNKKSPSKKHKISKELKLVSENNPSTSVSLSSPNASNAGFHQEIAGEEIAPDEHSNHNTVATQKKKSIAPVKTKLCEKSKKDAVDSSTLPDSDKSFLKRENSSEIPKKPNDAISFKQDSVNKIPHIQSEKPSDAKIVNLSRRSKSPGKEDSSSRSLPSSSNSCKQDSANKMSPVQNKKFSDVKKANSREKSNSPSENQSSQDLPSKSLPNAASSSKQDSTSKMLSVQNKKSLYEKKINLINRSKSPVENLFSLQDSPSTSSSNTVSSSKQDCANKPPVENDKCSDAKNVNICSKSQSSLKNNSSQDSSKSLSNTANSNCIPSNIPVLHNSINVASPKRPYNLRGKRKLSQRMQSSLESGDIGPKKTRKCAAVKNLVFDNVMDRNDANEIKQETASKDLALTESVNNDESDHQAFLEVSELCSQHGLDIHDILSLESVQKFLSSIDDSDDNVVLLIGSYKSTAGKILPRVYMHRDRHKLKNQLLELLRSTGSVDL